MDDAAYCALTECWTVLADPVFWQVIGWVIGFVVGMTIWGRFR